MQAPRVWALYDGIENPVFQGQVLAPIINYLHEDDDHHVMLISFEQKNFNTSTISTIIPTHPRLQTIIATKYPFLGSWSLWYARKQLHTILSTLKNYQIIARGPFAGYLCLHTLSPSACASFTLQARGLLAAEYEYTHQLHRAESRNSWLKQWRLHQYIKFEKTLYRETIVQKLFSHTTIEAVSPALKEHLISAYGIAPHRITIASDDLVAPISHDQRRTWCTQIRTMFNIPLNARVYCYNGSLKPWQCPQETIQVFKHEYQQNSDAYFLVLTQDTQTFSTLLVQHQLPPSCYHVIHVPHHDIMRYLAACDVGIVWREQHLMNWISRPTKILEYHAAGLTIMHNNTVAYAIQKIPTENGG